MDRRFAFETTHDDRRRALRPARPMIRQDAFDAMAGGMHYGGLANPFEVAAWPLLPLPIAARTGL
jgi:hypothetical protein